MTYICYDGGMRRTTIFLPEELHEQLRQDAFQERTSMAELIRQKLENSVQRPGKRRSRTDPILKVAGICRGPIVSNDIDKSLYGG